MPTNVKQIRDWLRGGSVEGLPKQRKPRQPDSHPKIKWKRCRECGGEGDDGKRICVVCDGIGSVPKHTGKSWADRMMEKNRAGATGGNKGGKYTISGDGGDALLLFGKHRDSSVSDIAQSNMGYLDWMLKQADFPLDLVDVIKYQMVRTHKRAKNKRWLDAKAIELGMPHADAKATTRDALEDYIMLKWKDDDEEVVHGEK